MIASDEVYYYYAITCLTAPFLGIITGGCIFSSIGGYNSPKTFPLILSVGCCCLLVSMPAPFVSSKFAYYCLIWLLLYLGAFMLPAMTGIMLNSVSEENKTPANSIANLFYNLFGYMPAPFVYGLISSMGDDRIKGSRYAMGCLMGVTLITALFFGLSLREWRQHRKTDQGAKIQYVIGDTGGENARDSDD